MATKKVNVVDVVRWPGPGIQLPEGMPLAAVIEALQRKMQEEEEPVDVQGLVQAAPMDGAIAFNKALVEQAGFAHQLTQGWPPQRNQVQVVVDAQGTTVTVPWGRFETPMFEGWLGCDVGYDDHQRIAFQITGKIKGKFKPAFEKLVARTKEIVRVASIYRGKALHLDNMDSPTPNIRFLDVAQAVRPIYPALVDDQVEHDFLSSITHPEIVRRMNNGYLKRGVLLEGPYGVGKTMLARWAARLCEERGITFALLPNPNYFPIAVDFLRPYFPALLFVEDMEQVAGLDRTQAVNVLLNKLDGVDTKGDDLICCFTTNHLNLVNEAMRRPGRIDLTLAIPPPDAEAALRIAVSYAKGDVCPDDDFGAAAEALDGMIPAVIAEAVKRAVTREAVATNGASYQLRAEPLRMAALAIQRERNLGRPSKPEDPMKRFAGAFAEATVGALAEHFDGHDAPALLS